MKLIFACNLFSILIWTAMARAEGPYAVSFPYGAQLSSVTAIQDFSPSEADESVAAGSEKDRVNLPDGGYCFSSGYPLKAGTVIQHGLDTATQMGYDDGWWRAHITIATEKAWVSLTCVNHHQVYPGQFHAAFGNHLKLEFTDFDTNAGRKLD